MEPYRQGDVLVIPVGLLGASIPADAKRVKRDKQNRVVLALGEVTGHAHAILDDLATLFTAADVREMTDRFLRVEQETVSLVHEEHGTIALPPGDYVVRIKREYEPERARWVCD